MKIKIKLKTMSTMIVRMITEDHLHLTSQKEEKRMPMTIKLFQMINLITIKILMDKIRIND